VATGQKIATYIDHENGTLCGGFSPDGKVLFSGGINDMSIRFRDLTRFGAEDEPRELTAERLQTLWKELAGTDATRAFEAACALGRAPKQSVPFLRDVLKPEPGSAVTTEQLVRWIADLGSDEFEVRERAAAELSRNARQAEALLRKALEAPPSAEAKKRLGEIVAKLDAKDLPLVPAERLQAMRGLSVLERAATPPAVAVIERLSNGPEGAWLTQQAKQALKRIQRRSGK
jgi:hypothetical protein